LPEIVIGEKGPDKRAMGILDKIKEFSQEERERIGFTQGMIEELERMAGKRERKDTEAEKCFKEVVEALKDIRIPEATASKEEQRGWIERMNAPNKEKVVEFYIRAKRGISEGGFVLQYENGDVDILGQVDVTPGERPENINLSYHEGGKYTKQEFLGQVDAKLKELYLVRNQIEAPEM